MFSHITVGVNDLEREARFHGGLMAILGHKSRIIDQTRGLIGWQQASGGRPLFLIVRPHDGKPATPGNGQMVAFQADSRAVVDKAHSYALANGGRDEGAPGLRPEYHADYYGAYFRDPEGNKFCVVCHAAEQD